MCMALKIGCRSSSATGRPRQALVSSALTQPASNTTNTTPHRFIAARPSSFRIETVGNVTAPAQRALGADFRARSAGAAAQSLRTPAPALVARLPLPPVRQQAAEPPRRCLYHLPFLRLVLRRVKI